MIPGPLNLITDVPGLRVGNAEDAGLNSGTTVLTADAPFACAVPCSAARPARARPTCSRPTRPRRGRCAGAVGRLRLRTRRGVGRDGGAARGGARLCRAERTRAARARRDPVRSSERRRARTGQRTPTRLWDAPLWRRRAESSSLAPVGAGTGAQTAMHKGGLGSASLRARRRHTVGALVAVNPLGSVTTPAGPAFLGRAFRDRRRVRRSRPRSARVAISRRRGAASWPRWKRSATPRSPSSPPTPRSTRRNAQRMAVAAHDGIARAIVPVAQPA